MMICGRLFADSPDAVVTFNELHYNPPGDQNAEWLEIHNQMAVNIDLSGWSLSDGISYTFPSGTVIGGGGFLVVAKVPGHSSLAGVAGVLGPFSGNLSNRGETIDLISASGRLMDRITYSDRDDWPIAPDGMGATLAKILPGSTSGHPANWRASTQAGGTPGGHNFAPPGAPETQLVVAGDAEWRYFDANEAPPEEWHGQTFDDSAWEVGSGPFGAADAVAELGVTNGLLVRHRAADITGVDNGSIFVRWPDTALADGTAQDVFSNGNPRFRTGATASGEAVVDFDGDDAFRASLSPGIGSDSGFVYFVVCKANATPVSGSLNDGSGAYIFDRAPPGTPLASLKAVGGRYGFQKRHNNGTGLGGPVSTTAISTSNYQIVAIRRNRIAGRFEIWVNGVLEGTSADSGAGLTPDPISIGRHSVGSNGFNGRIAEVLIYGDALSDEEFQAAGAYLGARHGIESAFSGGGVVTGLSATAETAYFRTSFDYGGDSSRTQILLDHVLADGAVVYLNGQEILRKNMGEGPIGHASPALSSDGLQADSAIILPPSGLVSGVNVLAVSLHRADSSGVGYFSATVRTREVPLDPLRASALVLNEISAAEAVDYFIEVGNPLTDPESTEGYRLETSQGGSIELPVLTVPPGGVIHFTEAQLGFRAPLGAKIVLRAPDGNLADVRLADSVARGLCAEWPGMWLYPTTPTPGDANAFDLQHDIVINEICYNPPAVAAGSAAKQWLELYNRGDVPVDLSGWQLAVGIRYTFPAGTVLGVDSYLVVAKVPGSFPTPPGTTVLGPYSGNLSNSGELLLLLDSSGNPADAVDYLDGDRWADEADGAGSSLELRNAHADNSLPESWAASDESHRRSWETHTYRATAGPSSLGPDNQWREFVFGLIDDGELLIDDISVIENPDTTAIQMIANGGFADGLAGWRCLGNHRDVAIVPDPDNPANPVLYLKATGGTEHMHNHVEATLANGLQVVNGLVYEISFRVRWLSGSNRLNTRLYFNRLARTTELIRTDTPGTPGAANSTAVDNLGPGFTAFSHSPVVPEPGESVVISARAADPDGIGGLTVHYSVNGGDFTSLMMDSSADGGEFSAVIPGQSAASVVRFHISATDGASPPATSCFPAGGAASHALYQVNDGLAATNGLQNIRIIMDPEDKELLYRTNNLMSNGRVGATVIYGESEVFYDVGVRLKSSQRGRPSAARVGFNIRFNKHQLFRGVHRTVAIDRSEGVSTGCQEILYDHMMVASGGVPAEFNDLCMVIAPNPAHSSPAILQLARFSNVFLDSQFEDGRRGTVYEYELVYYPTTTDAAGYKLPQPDSVVGVGVTDLGDDKENYRWPYLLKNNESVDDYSRIMAMAKHFDKSGAAFEDGLDELIDVDQWLRALAYSCASGAGDSFFSNARHNGQFYARPDGRVLYFPHDLDFAFSATRNIFENIELQKLIVNPARRRAYLGHLHEICTTVFNASYMAAWTAHFGSLLPGQNFPGHLNYINNRSNYILNAINGAVPPVNFAITTNGGMDFTTAVSPLVLEGHGWVDVKEIRLLGMDLPLEVTWTTANTWQVVVPLVWGPNSIGLQARDAAGNVLGADSIVVTYTGDNQLPEPHTLVISEIYYNPPIGEETEYIELLNTTAGTTLDLSFVSFTAGITFTFPAGTFLAAGERVLVVKNPAEFASAFGTGLPVAGGYPDNLSNSGELLELRRADGEVLHSFTYSDKPPWPVEADGGGYSLVLIDPGSNPDHGDPRHWRASLVAGGSPGGSDVIDYEDWKLANGGHGDDEDRDGDGFTTLQEFYLGGDPAAPDQGLAPIHQLQADGSLVIAVTRRAGVAADGPVPQVSEDLASWSPAHGAGFLGVERLEGLPVRDRLTFWIPPPEGEGAGAPGWFVRFTFGP